MSLARAVGRMSAGRACLGMLAVRPRTLLRPGAARRELHGPVRHEDAYAQLRDASNPATRAALARERTNATTVLAATRRDAAALADAMRSVEIDQQAVSAVPERVCQRDDAAGSLAGSPSSWFAQRHWHWPKALAPDPGIWSFWFRSCDGSSTGRRRAKVACSCSGGHPAKRVCGSCWWTKA